MLDRRGSPTRRSASSSSGWRSARGEWQRWHLISASDPSSTGDCPRRSYRGHRRGGSTSTLAGPAVGTPTPPARHAKLRATQPARELDDRVGPQAAVGLNTIPLKVAACVRKCLRCNDLIHRSRGIMLRFQVGWHEYLIEQPKKYPNLFDRNNLRKIYPLRIIGACRRAGLNTYRDVCYPGTESPHPALVRDL